MNLVSGHMQAWATSQAFWRRFAMAAILVPWTFFAFMTLHAWLDQPPPDLEFGKQPESILYVAFFLLNSGFVIYTFAVSAIVGIALYLKPASKLLRIITAACLFYAVYLIGIILLLFCSFGYFIGW